ncbi:NaeI family type II restriction endonuclease [Streptomyces sp. NPDC048639]|uniref:NaeI family type II restriction endonuclease n=1 Tax=Streptomyces sp. NPDC048639 TaxID=3365581 RepID=UPI00371B8722
MTQDSLLFDLGSAPHNAGVPPQGDAELEAIHSWFLSQRNYNSRFAQVFRKSIDEVLDGQRTGRFDLYITTGVGRVEKTEKTYLGTKVEIVARAEFELGYGDPMDYSIDGSNVDAKFTMGTNWAIPQEALGHICLLLQANDRKGFFRVGLLRITTDVLNPGSNKDGKKGISSAGRKQIRWIIQEGKLPPNFLLALKEESPEKLDAIWRASDGYRGSGNGGQLRTNELFRLLPGRLIDRTTVVTVATQQDGLKRARDARGHLRPEGFIILGHLKPTPQIANDLGLPIPRKGSFVSAKLTLLQEGDDRRSTVIEGLRYGLWTEGDLCVEAPLIDT